MHNKARKNLARKYYGKNRARQFYSNLEHLKNRIDKIIKSDSKSEY